MKLRKRLVVLAAVLAATVAVAAPGVGAAEPRTRTESAPAASAPHAVGPFQIRNHGTGRCMGFPYGDDRVRLWDCYNEAFLLWDLVADGNGRYHVVSRRNGDCLAGWAQGPNGWSTWLSPCDTSFTNPDQLWYVDPAHESDPARIANLFGRALEPQRDSGGGQEGARVEIWDYQGLPNQRWTLKYVM